MGEEFGDRHRVADLRLAAGLRRRKKLPFGSETCLQEGTAHTSPCNAVVRVNRFVKCSFGV